MATDDKTTANSGSENSNPAARPPLATLTCLDIAWSAVRRPFNLLPDVNPLEFVTLFSTFARSVHQLKSQTQPAALASAQSAASPSPATNSSSVHAQSANPPQPELLTMTHDEFRDFLFAVKASFDGFPHLWQRFSQLAREFMLSHSDPPSPKPSPA